jgi:hypothetical protein
MSTSTAPNSAWAWARFQLPLGTDSVMSPTSLNTISASSAPMPTILSPSCHENGGQLGWPVSLTTSAARAEYVSAINANSKRMRNMPLLYPKKRGDSKFEQDRRGRPRKSDNARATRSGIIGQTSDSKRRSRFVLLPGPTPPVSFPVQCIPGPGGTTGCSGSARIKFDIT